MLLTFNLNVTLKVLALDKKIKHKDGDKKIKAYIYAIKRRMWIMKQWRKLYLKGVKLLKTDGRKTKCELLKTIYG